MLFQPTKDKGYYTINKPVTEQDILNIANTLLARRFKRRTKLTSPNQTREYFKLKLASYEYEAFCAMFLNNQNQVLAFKELFRGTINETAIYPREVVKQALLLNAAAIIFVHNHTSGDPEPSQADKHITLKLKYALELVDIRVLDHFVVGGTESVSFAERGFL
ncbi:DNA repair protein RadC [Hafnia alvei]|uniref:RadC family protein n=1 Tax=Proteus vulgaris TaxID=585 RepID=UPI00299D66BE|nr:DNA repair protein RadC [Proteus vulgaris]WOO48771.1 DNA repair protein RadC [Hafnia alvei]WPF03237.1 DNA repair protein RadC [Proteus vulgaris]